MSEFITTTEAAAIIGCTVIHVGRLAKAKKIKGERWGKTTWQISRKSAEKYAKTPQKTGRPRGSGK